MKEQVTIKSMSQYCKTIRRRNTTNKHTLICTCRREAIWLQHLSSCLCAKGDFVPPPDDSFWPETVPVSALREEFYTTGSIEGAHAQASEAESE